MPLACATSSRRAALLLALAWSAAAAQSPDARLQTIEKELEQLRKRVDALEGKPADAAPGPAPQAPACAGWDRLKMSLTQSQVRALLGEPARIDATPLQIVWRYPCGRAYFDADTRRFVGSER